MPTLQRQSEMIYATFDAMRSRTGQFFSGQSERQMRPLFDGIEVFVKGRLRVAFLLPGFP